MHMASTRMATIAKVRSPIHALDGFASGATGVAEVTPVRLSRVAGPGSGFPDQGHFGRHPTLPRTATILGHVVSPVPVDCARPDVNVRPGDLAEDARRSPHRLPPPGNQGHRTGEEAHDDSGSVGQDVQDAPEPPGDIRLTVERFI